MASDTYATRRGQLETYFDRTAAEAWKRLTSDAPVSGVRATVRAGRAQMRENLLSWLPRDLHGRRILDAGCGTGVLATEAAKRGADVVAIDISESLVSHARDNAARIGGRQPRFLVGDMLDPALGRFDHIVAMDSLIHYRLPDIASACERLLARTEWSFVMTIAPRTPLLATMHAVGQFFPRGDRSPAIEPAKPHALRRLVEAHGHRGGREHRVARGFYISHAMEWLP
jgi:magnesium-protoporphyrin O-methyltransferase